MSSDVAGVGGGTLPAALKGGAAEAQHLSRYGWAAPMCYGRTVLEIGCGEGRGCAQLLEHGAKAVVGVDQGQAVIDAGAAVAPEGVRLLQAPADRLPFPDGAFELVLWFDPLPYMRNLRRAMDEASRVLAPDGLLVVGWPNREIVLHGGPEDRFVFRPQDLSAAISSHFPHVRRYRQTDWTASAIFDEETFPSAGGVVPGAVLWKLGAAEEGTEAYSLAVASREAHPGAESPPAAAVLARPSDSADWLARFEKQQAEIHGYLRRIAELEEVRRERDELRGELLRSEQHCAEVASRMAVQLQGELALVSQSLSWRVTRPLRGASAAVKAPARRLMRRATGSS